MSILVIGSSGYMGRHLVQGLKTRAIANQGISSSDGSGINPYTGLLAEDYCVPRGTTTVVYMAQSPRYREPAQASHVLSVNVLSAVRAAVAARTAGVKRFIYVSTGTVYAPSFHPLAEDAKVFPADLYSLSKIQGEQALQMFRSDIEVHIVRPFGVYGRGQRGRLVPNLIDSIREERPITLQGRLNDESDLNGLRISLCYVDDATQILINLIKDGGPPCLNLAGDQAPSIRTLANMLGLYLNKQPIIKTSAVFRNSDLVADLSLLRKSQSINFTSLDKGLESLINNKGELL